MAQECQFHAQEVEKGSWLTALPRGQRLDPVTPQSAFQLHGMLSMPWPTFLWLNAFSYFCSQLKACLLRKAF